MTADTLTLRGHNASPTGIFGNAEGHITGTGDAGTVVVTARTIQLTSGSEISSSTVGPGRGEQ